MHRTILTNARIVLPTHVVEGSVVIEDDRIAEITPGRHFADGVDLHGQWLIPGVIDIHTDYLEKEINPRPKTNFPLPIAFHMMDQRALACGLTTVLGGVRFSNDRSADSTLWGGNGLALAEGYEELRRTSLARHYLHVRWDTNFEPVDDLLVAMQRFECIGNIVYNENIPGERQFQNLDELARKRAARGDKTFAEARAELDERIKIGRSINNRAKVKAAYAGKICIGSHDDTTVEHVIEAQAMGATLAEMPTSLVAARKAKELGLAVCMGAPNYLRGGSHCGNLSAAEAIAEDLVDVLCSDYHFPSLLSSVVLMMERGVAPSRAVNFVTLNAARVLGREAELGSIEVGKKADLAAFHTRGSHAFVNAAWVDGRLKLQLGLPAPELTTTSVANRTLAD
jgi:alpha-D-ribose 1-methylphosphonate 5-triphosphate diphosphatase